MQKVKPNMADMEALRMQPLPAFSTMPKAGKTLSFN